MMSHPSQAWLEEARASLVESQLRPEGVIDAALLSAMGRVERERFVPEGLVSLAYSDRAIPLGDGRAMMPPASLALLIQSLEASPGDRVLVVGGGSGYAAAILTAMGLDVTAVESDPSPTATGRAPFDLILIDGAVEGEVPAALIDQLRDSGRLATGLIDRGVGRLAIGTRVGRAFGLRAFADGAVSVLPGFARARSFVF